jgi:hypothetical protein
VSSAISSISGAFNAPSAGGGALDAELAKCDRQLADWVHCPSGKTPEGKAKIEEITARRDTVKARIHTREVEHVKAADAQAPRRSPFDPMGGLVDVYA